MNKQNITRMSFLLLSFALMLTLSSVPVLAEGTAEPVKHAGKLVCVYGVVALLSLLLVIGYIAWEKNKEYKFILLYSCVAISNCGYLLLAIAPNVQLALWANRISYFGAAYAMLIMLLIIKDVCRIGWSRGVKMILVAITTAAFLLAASGGWSDVYYAAVDIARVDGMTRLVKTYGPLHCLYAVYLLSYFLLMLGMIVFAIARKRIATAKYAVFLLVVVLGNMCIWLVEQVFPTGFEFLSVSYIATELMLFLLYGMLRDYGILEKKGKLLALCQRTIPAVSESAAGELPPELEELFSDFIQRVGTLSAAERRILNYYIEGHEISQIPELAYISINTVKKHNRGIYAKLEISSRDELMLYVELFRRCGWLEMLTGQNVEQ